MFVVDETHVSLNAEKNDYRQLLTPQRKNVSLTTDKTMSYRRFGFASQDDKLAFKVNAKIVKTPKDRRKFKVTPTIYYFQMLIITAA